MTSERVAEREAAAPADSPAEDLKTLQNGTVGPELTIANEFTEVVVSRVDTRNGSRLLIISPRTGHWITIDPLEVEALTWQNPRTLAAMVGNMFAPLLPDEEDLP